MCAQVSFQNLTYLKYSHPKYFCFIPRYIYHQKYNRNIFFCINESISYANCECKNEILRKNTHVILSNDSYLFHKELRWQKILQYFEVKWNGGYISIAILSNRDAAVQQFEKEILIKKGKKNDSIIATHHFFVSL